MSETHCKGKNSANGHEGNRKQQFRLQTFRQQKLEVTDDQSNKQQMGSHFTREKHKVSCSGFLPTTQSMQHSRSHSNAICNHRFKKRVELRTQEQPLGAEHRGGTKTTPAATAAHTRYLSSPAAATLPGKTQGFVLRLPPHNTEHATFMQPFQCDLQPTDSRNAYRTTHTGTTIRCRTQRRNQPQPPHTWGTISSTNAATLHGKTPGFVLRLPPHNTEHATFMQPFQCDLQPQIQETHRTTHTGTTSRCRTQKRNQNDPSRNRRTHEVPFIAGCSHFTRKNARFRSPASSPQHRACNIHAAIPMRSATADSRNA